MGQADPTLWRIKNLRALVSLTFLDECRVRELLRMEELHSAVRQALADLSAGRVVQPVRVVVPVEEHAGFFGIMPAYTTHALGAKLVAFFPANAEVPTHHAIIALFRPETGEPVALMDGRLITEMRTAAASAVATDLLARPDASVLAILGSGVQAASHLEALRLVRPIREARVWSPRKRSGVRSSTWSASRRVRRRGRARGRPDRDRDQCHQPRAARRLGVGGAYVNAVEARRPEWRELDDDCGTGPDLADLHAAALAESGDVIAAGKDRVAGEIGAVAAEPSTMGRSSPREITLFKSLGVAVEDVVAAELVRSRSVGAD